jgi:enoyl-CoA hydratase
VLHVERQDGVVVWTIDRPKAKNALDYAMLGGLLQAVRDAAADRELRAVVITGAGDTFVSGGDLRELRGQNEEADAARLSDAGHALTQAIGELPVPVIAALPGPAIGGGAELAIACDLRVADARARIGFKQVRMGVTTAWGSAPRLVALVGAGTAARLLLTAQEIAAAEAKALGLVDQVTEDGGCRAAALVLAAEIALASPTAVAETKRLVREASGDGARELERRAFIATWSGADHRDAVEAYFERRPARWQPR